MYINTSVRIYTYTFTYTELRVRGKSLGFKLPLGQNPQQEAAELAAGPAAKAAQAAGLDKAGPLDQGLGFLLMLVGRSKSAPM